MKEASQRLLATLFITNLNRKYDTWKQELSNQHLANNDNHSRAVIEAYETAGGRKDDPAILVNQLQDAGSLTVKKEGGAGGTKNETKSKIKPREGTAETKQSPPTDPSIERIIIRNDNERNRTNSE